ncbi:MAG: bacillithiol system redox-active protein YtxJ [Flavobacteriales bacterium]
MSWKTLSQQDQVAHIIQQSQERPQLFFKHSTRCSISSMALRRFEQSGILDSTEIDCWYLDLLEFRAISDEIAHQCHVQHQSPQAILVQNGQILYAESHGMIDAQQILQLIA